MNNFKVGIGLTLVCIGIYASFMGIVASDTTDASFPAFIVGFLVGVAFVAGGFLLAIVGASER